MKLIGNSIILSTIEMLSESMTLAEKTGVGADSVAEWIKEFFPAPSAIGYSQKVSFEPRGNVGCRRNFNSFSTSHRESFSGENKVLNPVQTSNLSLLSTAFQILNNQFDGQNGFTLSGGIKDASHIRRLAESVDCPVPIIDTAHQHLVASRALGNAEKAQGKGPSGERDWSSLVAGQRISAGLPPFESRNDLLIKENK